MAKVDCIIGVKLSAASHDKRGYTASSFNPIMGTEYECGGVIRYIINCEKTLSYKEIVYLIDHEVVINGDNPRIEVLWDNGLKNVYLPGDLVLLNKEYKSIW